MNFVLFRNVDKETFRTTWNKELFVIEPGESITQEEGIAKKFAKELCNKVMIRDLPDTEIPNLTDHPKRAILMADILGEQITAPNIEQLLAQISRTKKVETLVVPEIKDVEKIKSEWVKSTPVTEDASTQDNSIEDNSTQDKHKKK
jgi:hypothetical protein